MLHGQKLLSHAAGIGGAEENRGEGGDVCEQRARAHRRTSGWHPATGACTKNGKRVGGGWGVAPRKSGECGGSDRPEGEDGVARGKRPDRDSGPPRNKTHSLVGGDHSQRQEDRGRPSTRGSAIGKEGEGNARPAHAKVSPNGARSMPLRGGYGRPGTQTGWPKKAETAPESAPRGLIWGGDQGRDNSAEVNKQANAEIIMTPGHSQW